LSERDNQPGKNLAGVANVADAPGEFLKIRALQSFMKNFWEKAAAEISTAGESVYQRENRTKSLSLCQGALFKAAANSRVPALCDTSTCSPPRFIISLI
jgi:hypothetical protein